MARKQGGRFLTYDSKRPAHAAVDLSRLEDHDFQTPDCQRKQQLQAVDDKLVKRDLLVVEFDHLEYISLPFSAGRKY